MTAAPHANMSHHTNRMLGAALALLAVGCAGAPTFESIKYGYEPERVSRETEPPTRSEQNDAAAGWTTPDAGAQQRPTLYGRDGSPVDAAHSGRVTQTNDPINDGVAAPDGGSRSLMLDNYIEAVEARDELQVANDALSAALDMAEQRALDLEQELDGLKTSFDALGAEKTAAEAQASELAARLATAQIARLEAERALLEATLEWRRMSAQNNAPLEGGGEGARHP